MNSLFLRSFMSICLFRLITTFVQYLCAVEHSLNHDLCAVEHSTNRYLCAVEHYNYYYLVKPYYHYYLSSVYYHPLETRLDTLARVDLD